MSHLTYLIIVLLAIFSIVCKADEEPEFEVRKKFEHKDSESPVSKVIKTLITQLKVDHCLRLRKDTTMGQQNGHVSPIKLKI